MPIVNSWFYSEDFLFTTRSKTIRFRRPINSTGRCFIFLSSIKVSNVVDCTMTIENTPFPELSPKTVSSTIEDGQPLHLQDGIVYDKIAILSTRGFANIYHNTEGLMISSFRRFLRRTSSRCHFCFVSLSSMPFTLSILPRKSEWEKEGRGTSSFSKS